MDFVGKIHESNHGRNLDDFSLIKVLTELSHELVAHTARLARRLLGKLECQALRLRESVGIQLNDIVYIIFS